MPALSLHAILRLPRSRRPAAAREWLKQEEARFPESIDETPSTLPEGTDRHPLDLILNLLPHQRPAAVRAWIAQEEPLVEEGLEREALAAGQNTRILRFPSAWTRYPDFQIPSEPWIELLSDGRRLYHSACNMVHLIPEQKPEPDLPPAETQTLTIPDEEDNTVHVVQELPDANLSVAKAKEPTPHLIPSLFPSHRILFSTSALVIDESPDPAGKLISRIGVRGANLRGPPGPETLLLQNRTAHIGAPPPSCRRRESQRGSKLFPIPQPATSYQLPATSYQLPATSYQLPATSYQLTANS